MIQISNTPKCFQCGSPLIEVSKKTEALEGSLFPQTTTIYRCSNEECQAAKDKELLKRQKLQDERTEAEQKRAEARQKMHEKKVSDLIAKEEES